MAENPLSGGGMRNFTRGGFFFSAGEHLRSAFDHSNLFETKKHHSVNIEHQIVCTKSMKLK